MIFKTVFRTIKKSLGRYIAILAIVALGVGFFAGLRVTERSIIKAADSYYSDYDLYDFYLISTLGFTDEDVKAFSSLDGVETAAGSVSVDFLADNGDDETESVLYAHNITENVNGMELLSGRMPEAADECVIDADYADIAIGDTIVVSEDNDEDTLDYFNYTEYTVVGTVNAVIYSYYDRGSTSLGNGQVAGFSYLLPEGMNYEAYTELYLTIPSDGEIYSDEYEADVDAMRDEVDALLSTRADVRYQTLYDDAESEILEAQEELDEKRQELADAQAEIDDGWETYNTESAEVYATLADSKAQLDAARTELNDGYTALAEAKETWEAAKVETEAQLAATEQTLTEGEASYAENLAAYEEAVAQVEMMAAAGMDTSAMEATLAESKAALDAARAELDAGAVALAEAKSQWEQTAAETEAQLSSTEQTLAAGEAEYAAGLAEYNEGVATAEAELAEAKQKLIDGQAEIDDALPQLEDAQAEIDDAYAELDSSLSPATLYLLDRESNMGYASLDNDVSIVSGVAKVFPVFFFLVAALVCITTMTRMVSEQRTENGVRKALGCSNAMIIAPYLIYAGSATTIGCVVGFFIGSRLLPLVLWQLYKILYAISYFAAFVVDVPLLLGCLAAYLIGTLGITALVCRSDLKESAAQLIRPKSPAAGKRIFLERIDFIWKRLKFLHKVTVRNIARYKQRMVMMIVGIGGCTALLIAGIGVRDSNQPNISRQYNEITLYDASVSFLKTPDESQRAEFSEAATEVAEESTFLYTDTVTVDTVGGNRQDSVNMVVYEEEPYNYIDLHHNGEAVEFPQTGEAVINYRLASENDIKIGDTITLTDDENTAFTVTVSGIFDNYINDYIYLSADTYTTLTGLDIDCNVAYLNFTDGTDIHTASALLLGTDNVSAVSLSEDLKEQGVKMLDRVNYVVLIILVCAGALSFIVLYNLTNITITERSREIATLNVLGFFQKEQNSYVFRENILLTGISAICGIPMGIALLYYVMSQIKISTIYFGWRLAWSSLVLSIVLTFVFTLIVDAILTIKIKKVNMAEAMKAIE